MKTRRSSDWTCKPTFQSKDVRRLGPITGYIAMRSLPDGSISGLLRKRATANPFTRSYCYSWSSYEHTSTTVWQKIRSVPHFLQPPAIDKEPESNAKMYVNQRRDEMARIWKHILRMSISARNTGTCAFFRTPFSTTFRWRFFLKPISRCTKSPFPSKLKIDK